MNLSWRFQKSVNSNKSILYREVFQEVFLSRLGIRNQSRN